LYIVSGKVRGAGRVRVPKMTLPFPEFSRA